MEIHLLEIAGKVAGLAGICVAAVLLFFREVIRRNILPRLSQKNAFSLIRLLSILMFSISVSGIASWGYIQMHRNGPSSENGTTGDAVKQPLVVAGRVVDEVSNDPIGQAAVTIAGRPESYITEDNGNFRIELDRSAAISQPCSNSGKQEQLCNLGQKY